MSLYTPHHGRTPGFSYLHQLQHLHTLIVDTELDINVLKAIFSISNLKRLAASFVVDSGEETTPPDRKDVFKQLVKWKQDVFVNLVQLELTFTLEEFFDYDDDVLDFAEPVHPHLFSDTIIDALNLATQLRVLRTVLCGVTQGGLDRLCNNIHKQQNLQELYLDGNANGWHCDNNRFSSASVAQLHNLTRLGIWNQSFEEFEAITHNMTKLTYAELGITDSTYKVLKTAQLNQSRIDRGLPDIEVCTIFG
jgi:hypothetical protein